MDAGGAEGRLIQVHHWKLETYLFRENCSFSIFLVSSFTSYGNCKVKGKEEPIAVFEPLGAGGEALRTKASNNFLDRGDHADHLQASSTGKKNIIRCFIISSK